MPELPHEPPPSASRLPPGTEAAPEEDYPLGCECADPALQIEAWREQAGVLPAPH